MIKNTLFITNVFLFFVSAVYGAHNINNQLHEAIVSHDLKKAQQLIAQGADVNDLHRDSSNSLSLALDVFFISKDNLTSEEVDFLTLLLDKGAMVSEYYSYLNKKYLNCLPISILRKFVEKKWQITTKLIDDITTIETLKYALAQVKKIDDSCIFTTIKENQPVEKLDILLNNKKFVDVRNSTGATPLHVAAQEGRYAHAQCILAHKAKVGPFDQANNTPLHYACIFDNADIVKLLIQHKASVFFKNFESQTPLNTLWVSSRAYELKDYQWRELEERVLNKIDIVRALIAAGAEVNTEDKYHNTPLQRAYWYGDYELFKMLIQAGAQATKNTDKKITAWLTRKNNGFTPIFTFDRYFEGEIELEEPGDDIKNYLAELRTSGMSASRREKPDKKNDQKTKNVTSSPA